MKDMLACTAQRLRCSVTLKQGREIGRLVEGEDFKCKKNDFEVVMINW
jgi:hypothetical protein